MKPDLFLLLLAVVLTFAQMLVAVVGAMVQVGLPALAGNREGLPPLTGWAGRAQRAHRNMLESLVLFAVLVLIAVMTDKANAATLFGAQVFVWARVAYAAIYLFGIPWLRTAAWFVSMLGLALIFWHVV
jgi:uncharacterized MAPEG superfamily protein